MRTQEENLKFLRDNAVICVGVIEKLALSSQDKLDALVTIKTTANKSIERLLSEADELVDRSMG